MSTNNENEKLYNALLKLYNTKTKQEKEELFTRLCFGKIINQEFENQDKVKTLSK